MTRLRATGPALTLPRRVERKYVLPQPRTRSAGAWLRHACRPAPQYATGSVSSCYFDTPNLDAYYESADGSLDKAKVRLRWYDEPSPSAADAAGRDAGAEMPAFLELKGRTRRRELEAPPADHAAPRWRPCGRPRRRAPRAAPPGATDRPAGPAGIRRSGRPAPRRAGALPARALRRAGDGARVSLDHDASAWPRPGRAAPRRCGSMRPSWNSRATGRRCPVGWPRWDGSRSPGRPTRSTPPRSKRSTSCPSAKWPARRCDRRPMRSPERGTRHAGTD